MTALIAWLLAGVLTGVAGLHVYWGLGGVWPGTDRRDLVRRVIGHPQVPEMPGLALTLSVAAAIALTALWPLLLAGLLPLALPRWLVFWGGAGIAAVFLLRGLAGASGLMRRVYTIEPFATLNQRYYSPLCLLLGLGYLLLLAQAGA